MEWISIKQRSPEENGEYLVFITLDKFGKGEESHRLIRWRRSTNPKNKNKNFGFWGNYNRFFYDRITHWMPLSKPQVIE